MAFLFLLSGMGVLSGLSYFLYPYTSSFTVATKVRVYKNYTLIVPFDVPRPIMQPDYQTHYSPWKLVPKI